MGRLNFLLATVSQNDSVSPFDVRRVLRMTIRYTCSDCQSVLKIKDEKAGTKAKCPKCKTPFVVPQPDDDEDGIEIESETPAAQSPPAVDDMVDMPIELTPEVAASDDFDPMDVLSGPGPTPAQDRRSAAPVTPAARKPSMADLMKDLEAAKKKEAKKSSAEMSRPTAASSLQTSGSAADMLSKAYQQKRESASAPAKTAKDAKAAEQRELLVGFIKTRALPVLLLVAGMVYAANWWMSRPTYNGIPLYSATGVVTKGGTPVAGLKVVFEPVQTDAQDARTNYQGESDADGRFTLYFSSEIEGAAAGDYTVSFMDKNWAAVMHPGGVLKLTVKPDDSNEFKIEL